MAVDGAVLIRGLRLLCSKNSILIYVNDSIERFRSRLRVADVLALR